MAISPWVAVGAILILFISVLLMWWFRYNEKKSLTQRISRRPQPYLGRLANNIYRVPLSHNYIYQTPPPSFSKAVKYPVPNRPSISIIAIEDIPPPTYEQYLKTQQQYISHAKSSAQNEQCLSKV